MRLKHIGLVWGKEMLNTVRDRRTLIILIVVPLLLMPLIVLGPNFLRISQQESRETAQQDIVVLNQSAAPELVSILEESDKVSIVRVEDPETALQEGDISAILMIPDQFESAVRTEQEQPHVEIRFDMSSTSSQTARAKLEEILNDYSTRIVETRITSRGLEPSLLNPFGTDVVNVAPPERVSGFFLGLLLPLFLMLWAAMGGAQTAIDVTAGEKERGTLESMLVLPASRTSFVVGKFLSVFVVSLTATMLALGGFALSLSVGGKLFPGSELFQAFAFAIAPKTFIWLVATTAVAAAMMSALTFALFIWTRNFKEAQSYTTYLSFGVMIPAFAVSFGDVPTSLTSYLIPIYNGTAVIKELLLGDINLTHIVLTYISSAVLAIIGLALSVRMFNNEKVLFRQ